VYFPASDSLKGEKERVSCVPIGNWLPSFIHW
jgi:hypothetical protein